MIFAEVRYQLWWLMVTLEETRSRRTIKCDLSPLVLPDEAEGEKDVQPEVGLVLVLEVAPEPGGVPCLEADHAATQQAHHRPGTLLHGGGLEITILTSMHNH